MNHVELLESCAAYALGVLDTAERQALEHHLAAGCPECASELAAMREASGALALAAPPARPTVRLKRRLLSRIGDDTFYFVLARDREWESPSVGVRLARLFIDPRDESETLAVELDAGADVSGAGLTIDTVFVIRGALCGGGAGPEGARLLALGAMSASRATAPGRITSLAPEAPESWRDLGSGCGLRPLGQAGTRAAHVIRVEAGHAFPEHDHRGAEELYVLSGDCVCEGERLGPGDYHRAPAGSHHAPTLTHQGCTAIVIG